MLAIVFSLSAFAGSKGYEIKIKITSLPNEEFFLSNFYAKNQYYKDTAVSDKNGLMVFEGDEPLEQGMYALVMGKRKIFDLFILENQHFTFETDTVNTAGNMKIKGSDENELFFEYIRYLQTMEERAAEPAKLVQSGSEEEKKQAKKDLKEINEDVSKYQNQLIAEKPHSFVAKFLKSMQEIDVPEPPKDENGNVVDSLWQYNYYKKHYFDNIDFSDGRLLHTPVYHQKLSNFIQKTTYQIPDSLISSIDFVCNKARASDELFRYTVSWITNTYEDSKIMGMDAIFIHMAENYYLTEDVDWVDSTQKKKIREHYVKNKPLLIGKVAPNIVLADTSQKVWYNLHKIEAPYLLVYIWSPTCGHCKKLTPKMHKLYEKYKEYGFKVYAVSTEYENKEWIAYINTHNLSWINVSDSPEHPNNIKDYPLNFRHNYDVYSTPKIYLLDKDKKIIAKRIENEQLDDLLGRKFGLIKGPAKQFQTDIEE